MAARSRKPDPEPEPPMLSVHQVVAYNFRRARELRGWTQEQTSQYLEPFLGMALRQAGVSAIEKTYDSPRRRNIDVAEVVAFARGFELPLGWFFLPPAEHGRDLLEPVSGSAYPGETVGDLIALVVGRPDGHRRLLDRLAEFDDTDHGALWGALRYVFDGIPEARWQDQLDLRRKAARSAALAKYADRSDEVIKGMAALLVELVRHTPLGTAALMEADPDAALELLAEGDRLVQPLIEMDRQHPNEDWDPWARPRYEEIPAEVIQELREPGDRTAEES